MKIPIVIAQQEAPSQIPVTVRPGTAGMEWGAAGELGQDFQRLALQISAEERQIREKFEAGQNQITLVRKLGDMSFFNQEEDKGLDATPEIQPLDRQRVFLERAKIKKEELLKDVTDKFLRQKLEAELDRNITVAALAQGAK